MISYLQIVQRSANVGFANSRVIFCFYVVFGWLRGSAVERRSLASELFLFCARPVADG